jgi:hypothetical protein
MRRFLVPVLLLTGLGLSQENYSTNWSGHRTLHINTSNSSTTGTSISANVLKYPVLVRLSAKDSAVFAAAKNNGADIRFTKSNNTTRLKHQIDTWDSAGRQAAVWVLIDTVYANNVTQSFRMHWGNSGAADSSNGNAVFDSANGFEAVWHFGDASGATPRANAVAGGKPATPAGNALAGLVPVRGAIGMADSLRSSTSNTANADHFTLDSGYTFSQGEGTLSMWLNLPTTGQGGDWNNFFALSAGTAVGGGVGNGGLTNNVWIGRESSTYNFRFGSSYAPNAGVAGAEAPNRDIVGGLHPLGEWNHFTVTFQDSGKTRRLYRNGKLEGTFFSTDTVNRILPVTRGLTFIGRSAWGDRNLRGKVDEARISKVARSADWVALDWGSQNPAGGLVSDSVAPTIAYAQDSVSLAVGYAMLPITVKTLTGIPHPTVSVSPTLPAGLSLTTNATGRGTISGTPTAASAKTAYVITATNAKGTSRDTVWITVTGTSEDYATWSNGRTLNFTSAYAATQYPLLVRLNGDSAVFAAGRNSLRFSKPNGAKLPYHIDTWDSAGRSAAVWVLMDQVIVGANSLRMHWGKAGAADLSNGSSVFARSNGFVTVHHLGDAAGTEARPNAVDTGNKAVPVGFPTEYQPLKGVIGMADSLANPGNTLTKANGGDHLSFGTLDSTLFQAGGGATLSIWVKATSLPGGFMQYYTIGNTVGGAGNAALWVGKNGTATNRLSGQNITAGANNGVIAGGNNSAHVGTWQHITMTVNGQIHKLYSNGALVAWGSNNQPLASVNRTANYIGAATWPDPTFDGVVDEARLANVERSADWIALDYATQQPNVSPLALSYEPITGNPGAVTRSPTLAGIPTKFAITEGTLPAGLALDSNTGVISGTVTGAVSANVTVTATSGVWSASAPVSINLASSDGAYATAWSGHRFVNVNTSAAVPTTTARLTKFPLLVRLGAADSAIFNASQANGQDIRFTKLNDVTRLPHEIDSWDKANRQAAIWVLVDTVFGGTSGSRLRLHWGNANVADSSKPGSVFDSSAYAAVFHLGGANATVARPNAVPGGNPATPANFQTGYAPSQGIIGLADSLGVAGTGSSGSYLSFGPLPVGSVKNGKVSYSAWIKKNPFTGWRHAISIGSGSPNNNFWFGNPGDEDGALRVRTAEGTVEQQPVNASGFWQDNVWQKVHVTFDGSAVKIYGNGVQAGEGDIGHTLADVNRTSAYIGRALWSADNKFLGVFDEVRVVKSAVSADWAKLEYENQKPASTIVTFSATSQDIVTGLNASALMAQGPALSFKRFGQGLLFQVRSDVASKVRLSIVDMHGRVVWNTTASTSAGMSQIAWNGFANNGQAIGSGIYAIRMSLLDENGKPAANLVRRVPLTR